MHQTSKTESMYELVQQWQQSGKTQKQFSEENHIRLHTFIYWVQKYRQSNTPDQGFASLTISQENGVVPSTPKVEIELTGGIVVRIY